MRDFKKDLESALKIAEIQADRLNFVLKKLEPTFPISPDKVENLNADEMPLIDMLIHRFSKLQDFMGSNLFGIFLENLAEDTKKMSMLDRINTLEKLEIIDAEEWRKIRELRNHLSHEYPERFDLMADFLNAAYITAPKLIKYLENIVQRAKMIR